MSDENQSETARTNETTKEKLEGTFDVLGSKIDGIGWKIARLTALLFILYIPTASVIDRLPMPELSDIQIVFISSLLVGLLVFYLPTAKGVSKIYSPQKEIVAKVNVTHQQILNAWSASPDKVDQMKVKSGRVKSFLVGNRVVHLVTDFDPDQNEGEGVHLKETADWEMIYDPAVIEKHRWRNNLHIQSAYRIMSILPDIGIEAEGKVFDMISSSEAEKQLYDTDYMDTFKEELPQADDLEEGIEKAVEKMANKDRVDKSAGGEDE